MTAEFPDRQRIPGSARVLNNWLRDAQNQTGVAEGRIGWLLASTVVVAARQRTLGNDQRPLFLIKGGLFMEFHLGLRARATKDVGALSRGGLGEFETALDATIAEPWGPFTLQRTAFRPIDRARKLIKPCRFDIKLLIKGAVWRRIQVEVSFPEGRIAEVAELIPVPPVGYFGIAIPARFWPPRIVANEEWIRAYPGLAEPVGVTVDLDEAMAGVNGWIAEINRATR